MKDKLHEQISALVDDELGTQEQAFLTWRIGQDDDLQQRLSRYQLISDAMQDHLPEQVDPGFTRRVHVALRDEPASQTAGVGSGRMARLWRPVAGLAVAASVAVVAVTALQTAREEAPAAVATVATVADSGFIRTQENGQSVAAKPRIESSQLDVYLVNHNEFATSHGMQGMLPYVRIVGHDMNRDSKE